ncbi:hypothetical protein AMECASPLE_013671, partial [Ameca splendens]
TPLLVRSSSDSALNPQTTETKPSYNEDGTVMVASPDVEGPTGMERAQGKHTFSGRASPPPDPEKALYPFPAQDHGLGLGGCFTLGSKLLQ